jgi:hypothetical protein
MSGIAVIVYRGGYNFKRSGCRTASSTICSPAYPSEDQRQKAIDASRCVNATDRLRR